MLSPIEICVCFDETMRANALMLTHLLKRSCYPCPVRLHLVHAGSLPIGEFDLVKGDIFDIADVQVAESTLAHHANRNISAASFLRLNLPFILASVERVLYLDVDLLPRRSLASLYMEDMQGCCVAAVPDVALTHYASASGMGVSMSDGVGSKGGIPVFDYIRDIVGIPSGKESKYFNAGVLLLDLKALRMNDYKDRLFETSNRATSFALHDQDILNSLFWNDYTTLDTRWNVPANCSDGAYFQAQGISDLPDADIWRRDPWILHYSGSTKPWNSADFTSNRDDVFWATARTTPAYRHFLRSSPRIGARPLRDRILEDIISQLAHRLGETRFV